MEYNTVFFGDVAKIKNGYAFKSKEFKEEGIPVIKIKNIISPIVDIKDTQKVSIKTYEETKNFLLKKDDILISLTGSGVNQMSSAVGKVGKIEFDYTALQNQRVGKFELKYKNSADLDFLFYYFLQPKITNYLVRNSTGSANQANISSKLIETVKIPNFSLKKQKSISKILNQISRKIEINKKIIANLEELSQTLFKRWFVDFEFPDENGNPYKSSGGELVDSELGEKPINWDVAKLRSIVNIRTGYAFKSTEYVEQRQLPVLRTLNISKSNLLVTMNEIKYVPYQYLYIDKYKNYNLELFDTLLVTVGGSIGNLGLVTENNIPSLQNQNMWRFRSIKSNIGNTLVYQLILYVNSLVRNQTSGSAREFYTKKIFENFSLLLPKEDSYLYENINKYLENFGKKISDLNVEIEKLTQLRDTLLPKLMSGEIEIPDDIEVNEDELSI